jgi:hypothetical protein
LLIAALGWSCGGDPAAARIIVSVTVAPHRDTLGVGETSARLSAVAHNAGGDVVTDAPIVWTSDQPFLAAVDSLTGAVKGLAIGAAAITASVGPVSDTAQVFVVSPVTLNLRLDTLLLAVGDTFTIPAVATSRSGPTPALTYGGGGATIATVNPQTGLVTGIATGIVPYQVFADTFAASGVIAVLALADTTGDGSLTLALSGAIVRQANLAAKGYNFPTLDNQVAFQLSAVNPDTLLDHFAVLLLDTVNGAFTRPIGVLPASGVSDPVCHPPDTWAFYRHTLTAIRALSLAGTFTITRTKPLTGGIQASGRFLATMKRSDQLGDTTKTVTARGSFVIPVVSLGKCPQ